MRYYNQGCYVKYSTVLFDLDGTLLESARGVFNAFRAATRAVAMEIPEGFDQRRFIGPPLLYSFETLLGMDEKTADTALKAYRDYYGSQGLYEADLYPGVTSLLADLKTSGACMCLATSKYSAMAERMLDHFGIRSCFDYTAMSNGTEATSAKSRLITQVLEGSGSRPDQAVMIGDTHYDAEGARDTGVHFVGVLYGYGTREEMLLAGASVFVETVEELCEYLL